MANKNPTAADVIKALKQADKKEFSDLVVLSESRSSFVKEWISTGSYALNKIISGDPRKGIPVGLITALAGEESTGKSYLGANITREAQKDGFVVIYIETENSPIGEMLTKVGADPENIIKPENCFTIADVKNNLVKVLRETHKQFPSAKILVILDSLGNLVSDKQFYGDIDKDKIGNDQGMKAKELKAFAAILTTELGRCNGTMVVINHIYIKPGQNPAMPPEHVFSGGSGFLYTSSVIVYMYKRAEKEEKEKKKNADGEEEVVKKARKTIGVFLRGTTKKNRIIPEGKTGEFHISFQNGMNKWFGLIDDAIQYGFIEYDDGWFNVKHLGKRIRAGELYTNVVWQPIFDQLCDKIAENNRYIPASEGLLEGVDDLSETTEKIDDVNNSVEGDEKDEAPKKRGRKPSRTK
jgi:RecA/RadA recombinase